MLRTALAMFMIGGMASWGQAQSDTSGGAVKVDRATAYYHFTLAQMYAEMAAAPGGRHREYADKAMENYKAAIKADPQLSEIYPKGPRQRFVTPVFQPPASRQDRSKP
jgi:hypothetical protein